MMDYARYERKAVSLLNKIGKKDAPAWLVSYAGYRIDRARFFRKKAASEVGMGVELWEGRYHRSVTVLIDLIEILELHLKYDGK
jgi:hypothetical protein